MFTSPGVGAADTSLPEVDYRAVFTAAPGLFLLLTPDLRILDASDAYLHAAMTRREQIVGRHLFDVFPEDPEDPGATGERNVRASLDRVLELRRPDVMAVQKYDLRRAPEAGGGFEERYWSPINAPVLGPDGEIRYIIHRVEDVTEFVRLAVLGAGDASGARRVDRRAAEVLQRAQELQEANRQLSSTNAELRQAWDRAAAAERQVTEILESITDAFYAVDAGWRITYANRRAEALWRRSRSELLGSDLREVFPKLRGTEVAGNLERVLRDRIALTFDARCPIVGRWYDMRMYPAPSGAAVYLEDITQRRRAIEAVRVLAEAGRALSASLDYRSTLEAVARLLVPRLADLCVIDLVGEDGRIERAIQLHAEPGREATLREIPNDYLPHDANPKSPATVAIRTREPVLWSDFTNALADDVARDERHRVLIREFHPRSLIAVPLVTPDRLMGALTVAITEGERRFDRHDLELVAELGRRAAVAIDNAQLYARAEETAEQLESQAAELEETAAKLEATVEELRDANEELQRQTAELERARRAAVDILESITDAFYAVDESFRFTYVNRRAEEIWQRRREDLLGRVVWEVFPQLVDSAAYERVHRAAASRQPDEFEMFSPLSHRWVYVHLYPRESGLSVFFRDITAQKQTEEERARSQSLVNLLKNVAVAANEATTVEHAFRTALDQVCTTMGCSVGHLYVADGTASGTLLSGNLWYTADPDRCRPFREASSAMPLFPWSGFLGQVFAEARPIWVEDVTALAGFRRREEARQAGLRTGIAVPVLVGSEVAAVLEFYSTRREKVDPVLLEVMSQVGTMLGRVIERQKAEEARKCFLSRIVEAQEEERRRLSRELHDKMGQHLVALMLVARSLRQRAAESVADPRLAQLDELAEAIGRESRDLALALRPTILDDFGLESAIREYAEQWSAQTDVAVDLHVAGLDGDRPSPSVETAVYRIVQEALTNVARHADAGNVSIIVERSAEGLNLIIEDDGVGFDAEAVLSGRKAGHRLGLLGMQERMALLGGTLGIESAPGDGTTVFARFPDAVPRPEQGP